MDSLKEQYEKLSNEEKSILLIYKSGLSDGINYISLKAIDKLNKTRK